jgi:hypothetical protein
VKKQLANSNWQLAKSGAADIWAKGQKLKAKSQKPKAKGKS